ncbi:bis(5'-nucleosyl)-tetraphosphatase (symmetrical) YqeK [Acidaminobacter hydrogenoformans]|uniref:bis(5'-nucleosyl)-tetraphosphatase (symmetrical) n=1 Tax=Acidaminobacter hydrogenoformans DSM 2784 TaxID=1120920 RepID=A0A1G5RSW7_9FIRM|nr:bis(5'-nucleosyl)-tetraphosphatase (symmetrical) YqeK [Acidaminobacter hydrogenoformans]SCZ77195.1 putative HD superfamily hydrolase of NAD metabolism [Acidaminobacter hydrogenoformans DSM 2784]
MKDCQIENLSLWFPILQEDYDRISGRIKQKRLKHTLGVLESACVLSERYGGDLVSICRAALYHDLFKGVEKSELLTIGGSLGYIISGAVDERPEIAHGPIAALWLEHEGIVKDSLVLNAIRYHTIGRRDMSLEEKIVYLADAIEPGRDYPGVETVRLLAETSLDQALLCSVSQTLEFVLASDSPIHPESVEMRNALLETIEK